MDFQENNFLNPLKFRQEFNKNIILSGSVYPAPETDLDPAKKPQIHGSKTLGGGSNSYWENTNERIFCISLPTP